MKTPHAIPLFLALAAGSLAGNNPRPAPTVEKTNSPRVEVVYFERENFTDVRDSFNATPKGRDYILDQLRTHLEERAKPLLRPGERLQVTITDVDLAGDFEPWRTGGRLGNVRIVKEIYPPRITLSFVLAAADGEVVKQGTRDLTNLTFQTAGLTLYFDQPLRYEKTLIDDWLSSELPKTK